MSIDRLVLLRELGDAETSQDPHADPDIIEIEILVQLRRRGVEAKLLLTEAVDNSGNPDPALIKLLAQAYRWEKDLRTGSVRSVTDLATREKLDRADVGRVVGLAYMAPDLVQAIIEGRQPGEMTASSLNRIGALPPKWSDQRRLFGIG